MTQPPGRHAPAPARPVAAPPPAQRRPLEEVAEPRFEVEPAISRPTGAVSTQSSAPWQARVTYEAQAVVAPSVARSALVGLPSEAQTVAAPVHEPPRQALSYELPRLHAGWHSVSAAMLRGLSGGGGATGLMLGVDYQRQPVPIRFFRPEPTRVTLVGGLWAQRILVFRALALGARVLVMTGDPRPWQGLGEWATGLADRMVLWTDPRPPAVPASARQPLLLITDPTVNGLTPRPELTAWQTQVTVLRHLGAEHAHTLQGCNLVMLQRLSRSEAAVAGSALNLTEKGAGLLQEMTPEMLALMGGGANRYVWLAPTSVEQQYHGPPQR